MVAILPFDGARLLAVLNLLKTHPLVAYPLALVHGTWEWGATGVAAGDIGDMARDVSTYLGNEKKRVVVITLAYHGYYLPRVLPYISSL